MWNLHKKVETQQYGSEDDSSEAWEDKITYYLVRFDEEDAFQESLVSDYESQDYYYSVSCKKIASFANDDELRGVLNCISQRVFIDKLKDEAA